MELKDFDDSKGSDQGTGGIPLDEINKVKASLGVPHNPEESQAVRGVLDREVAALEGDAGGEPEPEPQRTEEPAAPAQAEAEAEAAPTEEAEKPAEGEAAKESEGEDDELRLDPTVFKEVKKKYRGKFGTLAKDYAQKDAALKRSDERIMGLERTVSALARTVEDGLKRAGLTDTGESQQPAQPEPPKISREDYEEDPVSAFYKVADYVTRTHNQQLLETIARRDAQREQQAQIEARQEQLDHHKERINRIYAENPQRWEALPRDVATDLLLEQAALMERVEETESDLGRVLQGAPATTQAPRNNSGARTVRGGTPDYAGLGAGRQPTIRPGAPGSQRTGDLRKTDSWKRLANSRPDSEEETMALAGVLRDMGHWKEKGQ